MFDFESRRALIDDELRVRALDLVEERQLNAGVRAHRHARAFRKHDCADRSITGDRKIAVAQYDGGGLRERVLGSLAVLVGDGAAHVLELLIAVGTHQQRCRAQNSEQSRSQTAHALPFCGLGSHHPGRHESGHRRDQGNRRGDMPCDCVAGGSHEGAH